MAFAGSITSKSYGFMGFSLLQALLKSLIVVVVQTFKVYIIITHPSAMPWSPVIAILAIYYLIFY